MKVKTCPNCKEEKPIGDYWVRSRDGKPASRCKACSVLLNREWRKKNPDYEKERYRKSKKQTRERHLVRKYGVTLDDYNKMLEVQGGKCAICGRTEDTQHNDVLHVDHCHKTGAVRGLLCRGCNHVLGHMKDDVENLRRAIDYLSPKSPK